MATFVAIADLPISAHKRHLRVQCVVRNLICDGTMIGFRKDFLPKLHQPTDDLSQPTISGSKHSERILVSTTRARSLLMKYAATTKDRKQVSNPKPLSTAESRELCQLLRKDFSSLAAFLQALQRESGKNLSPPEYHQFFSELARCSPACGIFQTRENESVFEILQQVAEANKNIFDSKNHAGLVSLQDQVPIMVMFLHAATKGGAESLPDVASELLTHILDVCRAPYIVPLPPPSFYLSPAENDLSFSPQLPLLTGKGKYAADKLLSRNKQTSDSCRKDSYGHPSLSPGIFTIFCPHGICYGFEVMQSCESPMHPFSIFRQRFRVAPHVIIYDNACKLHQYCLNREPQFFSNTLFAVDRFHWRGHVGCSAGYSLDTYKNMSLREINSQVNEQANAGLQRIRGQLAYMTPENFMFTIALFFSVKNSDVQRKLDFSAVRL